MIIRKIPWTRQPAQPRQIDWGNPLTNKMVGCWMPSFISDGTLFDAVNNNTGVSEALIKIVRVAGKHGLKTIFDNSDNGSHGYNLGMPPELDMTDEITVVQGLVLRADPGGTGWGRSYSKDNGSTGDQVAIIFRSGDGDPDDRRLRVRINGSSVDDTEQLPAETLTNIALVYKSGFLAGYVNGKERISTSAITGNINAGDEVEIGGHHTASRGFSGDIYYTYVFNRALTPEALFELHRNPWQVFRPRTLYIPEAVVTGAYTLTADAGAYVEAGIAATLQHDKIVAALAGAYTETGQAADLEYGRKVGAQTGAYSVVGTAANLTYTPGGATYTLAAEGGTYAAAGQVAGLQHNRKLSALGGAYVESGTAARLAQARLVVAVSGVYQESGKAADLKLGYNLVAAVGAYSVNGSLASLLWSGAAAGVGGPAITAPLIISNGKETALPISVAVSSGRGVSGLTVLISIRDGSTSNSYLDFNDLTFKTSGWANITDALADQSGGYYTDTLDVSSITNLPAANLIVEFDISGTLTAVAMSSIILAKSSILGASNALTLGKFLALKDV